MNQLTLIIALFFTITVFGQNASTDDAESLKKTKIVVAYKEYPKKADADEILLVDSVNAAFKFAMDNYWDFTEIAGYMSLEEAKDYIKENKGSYYITIDIGTSMRTQNSTGSYNSQTRSHAFGAGSGHQPTKFVSYGEKLSIYDSKHIAQIYLPHYDDIMPRSVATFAVMQMNKTMDLLLKGEFSSIMKSGKYVKENGKNVTQKTLLIPKGYINPKVTEEEIKAAYPHPVEFCDLSKIEKAILERDEKYAVSFYVPIPLGGKYLHRVYITNAADGDYYGAIDGTPIDIDLGLFGSIGQSRKKYLINDSELKQIAKMVE